jgi:deoxyribose-phosphate aldolase
LVKVVETKDAIAKGTAGIDMFLNIEELRSRNYDYVRNDIQAVVEAAGDKAIVKVISEDAYLTPDEIEIACKLSKEAGAAFVKTSTGFTPGGATVEDIKLMRKTVSDRVEVKAAGGIRSLDAAFEMIDLGVTRIGATATSKILDEFERRKGKM